MTLRPATFLSVKNSRYLPLSLLSGMRSIQFTAGNFAVLSNVSVTLFRTPMASLLMARFLSDGSAGLNLMDLDLSTPSGTVTTA